MLFKIDADSDTVEWYGNGPAETYWDRQHGAKPMFFSALPYTPHEMESAKHPYELPPVHYTVIRAMGEQMGVGGDDSWGANVHPEYIPDVTKPVEFTFTFRGI